MPGLQPWPWAINADGQARYFDSKAAAVAWTGQALARGVQQIDVGCMQINLQIATPTPFATSTRLSTRPPTPTTAPDS